MILFLISLILNIFLVIKYFKAKSTGIINTDRVDNFFGLFLITMVVLLIFAPSIKANRDLHVNTDDSFNFAVTNMGRVFEKMENDLFEEDTGEIKDEKIVINILRNGRIDFYLSSI